MITRTHSSALRFRDIALTSGCKPAVFRKLKCAVKAKMYVPSDSFGGLSPERKAANALRNLFTFIAAKIILAQLEGSGRGALAAYNKEAYEDLSTFLLEVPLKDGDVWLEQLMRKNSSLALRVMEVRKAYCTEEFEWDNLQRVASKDMQEANVKLMRKFASASLLASLAGDSLDVADGSSADSPKAPGSQDPGA